MRGSTHTFVILDLSPAAFGEIRRKLMAVGYGHAFTESDGRDVIDMQGIAVARDVEALPGVNVQMPEKREDAAVIFSRYGGVSADLSILLRTVPTSTELANAKASAIARGVPHDIVERAAELIGFGDPK